MDLIRACIYVEGEPIFRLVRDPFPMFKGITMACRNSRCAYYQYQITIEVLPDANESVGNFYGVALSVRRSWGSMNPISFHASVGEVISTFKAASFFTPLILRFGPDALPIVKVFLIPAGSVKRTLIGVTFLQCSFGNFFRGVLRVVASVNREVRNYGVRPPMPAFTVERSIACLVTGFDHLVKRPEQRGSNGVDLGLRVSAVNVEIILPVPTLEDFRSLRRIVTHCLVNVPRKVFHSLGNGNGQVRQDVRATSFGSFSGYRVCVSVVVGSQGTVMPFFRRIFVPEGKGVVLGGDSRRFRFNKAAVATPWHLPNPDAFRLVLRRLL